MSYREAKKERELTVCGTVAAEINRTTGADYHPVPGSTEPIDVMLVSQSGAFEARPLQVVSIPIDYVIRLDNHNVEKARGQFSGALSLRGFHGCHASMGLTDRAKASGVPADAIASLADLATTRWEGGGLLQLTAEDDFYPAEPRLCDFFHYIHLIKTGSDRIHVTVPQACWIPSDGRWIEDAVKKKTEKTRYDRGASSKLALVIDGSVHLDSEQIGSFRRGLGGRALPFREVWIVSMSKAVKL